MLCGLSWWLSGKESTCQSRRCGTMPVSGRFPVEGNGNPLQFSCFENQMNRGAWQAAIHGVAKKSDMTYWIKQQKLMMENLAQEFVPLEYQKLFVLPTWKDTWRKHLLQWREEQIYCSVETIYGRQRNGRKKFKHTILFKKLCSKAREANKWEHHKMKILIVSWEVKSVFIADG